LPKQTNLEVDIANPKLLILVFCANKSSSSYREESMGMKGQKSGNIETLGLNEHELLPSSHLAEL
jgi:hypothetical protein